MGNCCSDGNSTTKEPLTPLSAEEIEERRTKHAAAAESRSKTFKGGGGGEKLKAKSKKLEEAERKNQARGGNMPHSNWYD